MNYPDFFTDRTQPWQFEDVLAFINSHFDTGGNFTFRVGQRSNSRDENQRAGVVLAYAQLMNYTFDQVKALFAEHDHFAIAMPETRIGRNILEINRIYKGILKSGADPDVYINDHPEYFDIPKNVLTQK